MKKRSKFYLYSILTILFFVAVSGYLYLPGILGDTVYPLEYTNYIVKWSATHRVPADLTAAVILQESRFNPRAKSPVGALGLMQIMPTTGSGIAKGVEDPNFTTEKLFDPETNIKYGTWYLRTLLDRYDNNAAAALTAYNTGSGNVDRWFFGGLFGEGNRYAQNVLEYQKIYANFYSRELYGVDAKVKIEKPKQNFLWSRMVKDLVGVFYEGK